MKNKKIVATMVVFLMLVTALPLVSGAEDTEQKVLFDMGNGTTYWVTPVAGNTIGDVLNNTANANGISYDSTYVTVIGDVDSGGSFQVSGTTGTISTSIWSAYVWNGTEWVAAALTDPYDGSVSVAAAFYPAGTIPPETPDDPSSWTMIRGDAEQTGTQDYSPTDTTDTSIAWTKTIRSGINTYGVYSSVLSVGNYLFVKFGSSSSQTPDPFMICYDLSGELIWRFDYPGIRDYETTTPVIAGDYIYIQSGAGFIFKLPWKEGPGENNENVTSFNGTKWEDILFNDDDFLKEFVIPYDIYVDGVRLTLTGTRYSTGPGSMVFDSGCIYTLSSNGMIYCFDMDLNLIWSYQMEGQSYYMSPTVVDGFVIAGALNGHLYVVDKVTGEGLYDVPVYQYEYQGRKYGLVAPVSVIKNNDGTYTLIFSISDGRGMSSTIGGIGIYTLDHEGRYTIDKKGGVIKEFQFIETFGMTPNYLQVVVNNDFKGVYFASSKGLYSLTVEGRYTLLNETLNNIKAPPTLVNGNRIFLVSYLPSEPIYQVGLDGRILSMYSPLTTVNSNYKMSPAIMIGGLIIYGTDAGVIALQGTLPDYVEPENTVSPWWIPFLILFILIIAVLAAIYIILRLRGLQKPFTYLRGRLSHYLGGDDLMHNTRNKHRLLVVILMGITVTLAVFILSMCKTPEGFMSVGEMFSSLFSAVSKGGTGLTYEEVIVYNSNLPRTIMALLTGIGLSVAGCMYQAIIRNPLVDPYIMGVSAGAGTAAVAVIGFNFTFFGLFSAHSIYLTAVCAIVGGIAAFVATMMIAEKAGGSSLNYVLAGVVIGLALSSLQSLMLSMAGNTVRDALGWLFGSFAQVTMDKVRLVVFPIIALALAPLLWAREFNLVLLGEDQAQQMGLNVRKFSRTMLIIASVLTALCVAFCGIIGFVGLVIPHLCRMILGGDHRLVLPTSIAIGGALMIFADLAARTLLYGQELPVGAITTMIGVPVFAYLLIKRGKLYEG